MMKEEEEKEQRHGVKNKKVEAKKKKTKKPKQKSRSEAAQYVDNLLELQKVQAAVLNQLKKRLQSL